MRRVYFMNTKRTQIVQEAILHMRSAQRSLGPEFITRIKMLLKDVDPEYLERILSPKPEVEAVVDVPPTPGPAMEPVDRKKNLVTIMTFLQLNPENKNVQTQVRTLLADIKA